MSRSYNKGEWSELYAFLKLLKDGRIYEADKYGNKIENMYLPIIKIIRNEKDGKRKEFLIQEDSNIYVTDKEKQILNKSNLSQYIDIMFNRIFDGTKNTLTKGAFTIPEINEIMDSLGIEKIKASSLEKVDLLMQIHDYHTGFNPEVGFSIKSDVGSPPTLLNPGKNTNIKYKIIGLDPCKISQINSINKNTCKNYMQCRIDKLIKLSNCIEFSCIKNKTYEDNLIMIDSCLPRIFGEIVLQHYLNIDNSIYNCSDILQLVENKNPINYRRPEMYQHKFKKMLCASALGMTPGKPWNGIEAATGGYLIIKKNGDILCYHLYNRNEFESYLLSSTKLDRPSSSRYDYGYVYEENGELFIDFNVQIRFKSIK